MPRRVPQIADMPRRKKTPEQYDTIRQESGWFLAAWRDFRGLSQQELADEMGTSKSVVSDLEVAPTKRSGAKVRFNRDNLDAAAKALRISPGFLIDVNPFRIHEEALAVLQAMDAMDDATREQVARMVAAVKAA